MQVHGWIRLYKFCFGGSKEGDMVDGLGEGAARKNRQMLVGKGHEDQMLGKEQVRDMQKQRKGFNINQNHVSFIR